MIWNDKWNLRLQFQAMNLKFKLQTRFIRKQFIHTNPRLGTYALYQYFTLKLDILEFHF
jgi:hypothetical protein